MVNAIPNNVRKTWDAWNIRGVILISLGFQIFLILFSPIRKRTNRTILTWSIWSAYLLADYSANLCIGLIFDKRGDISTTSIKDYIVVFWAPFLLLHLGGQDTITAYSLEDNQLWLRHLLSLVFQLVSTVYVFLLTIPGNTLWLPTVLVFLAGIIKYIERTRSLYLASMDTFRKSVMDLNQQSVDNLRDIPASDTILMVSEQDVQQTEADYVELVRKSYEYFKKFKGLVVDKTYSFVERNESRRYFLNRTPEDALTIIEVELNFIYEYFFTKASMVRTKVGFICRFTSFSSILAALFIFFLDKKHGFHKFDVKVTYVLLLGAVCLEFVAFLMLILSDWAAIRGNVLIEHFLKLKKPKWLNCKKKPYMKFKASSTNSLFGRWSGTISGHDLITYWLRKSQYYYVKRSKDPGEPLTTHILPVARLKIVDYFGATELLEKCAFKANNPFLKELWGFIFSELRRKSVFADNAEKVKIICEARGGWIFQENDLGKTEKDKLMPYVNFNDIAFDDTLIKWHLVTNICYHAGFDKNEYSYFSKVLSDYMLYLLAMEPGIMSTVAGIGQQRMNEIISSLVKFSAEGAALTAKMQEGLRNKKRRESYVCAQLLSPSVENQGFMLMIERAHFSILNDAVKLARELRALEENKRWKIMAQVWVEMLSYAAINCRPDMFVQQLSKGGQLISFVWLSMLHLGLGSRQFKNQE